MFFALSGKYIIYIISFLRRLHDFYYGILPVLKVSCPAGKVMYSSKLMRVRKLKIENKTFSLVASYKKTILI